MRIGKKLFLTVGALIVVVSVSQGGIPVVMISSELERNAIDNMQGYTRTLADMLKGILAETEADIELMRAHKAIENYLTLRVFEDLDGMEEELSSLEAFLARVSQAKPQYTRMQLVVDDHAVLQLKQGARSEKFDRFDNRSTKNALETAPSGDAKSIIHAAKQVGDELILLSAGALQTEDQVEGLLWLYQPIKDRINNALSALAKDGFTAVITGRDDEVIAYSVGSEETVVAKLATGGVSGWLTQHVELPLLGWKVTLGVDESQAFSVVRDLTFTAVIMLAVSLAIAFGILAFLVSRVITRPIGRISAELGQIAEGDGDLTVFLDYKGADEIADLASAFNSFVAKIREAVSRVSETTVKLTAAAQALAAVTGQSGEGVARQQSDIDQVATAMTEMTATIQEVARTAASAAQSTQHATEAGDNGKALVRQTIDSIGKLANDMERAADVIQRLETSSEDIGSILDVIRGVAEQTNLLALNAAIEAARAGEHGRGFAVVAEEVRTLAKRTQDATQEIQDMIARLQTGAHDAVSVLETERGEAKYSVEEAKKAGAALGEITEVIGQLNDMNTQIASSAEEQTLVSEEINRNIIAINGVATQTAQGATNMAQSAGDLANLAANLESVVQQFKV